ncbi:hypothetical protein WN093_05890 [Gammaproteobacteria bacterium AS21]
MPKKIYYLITILLSFTLAQQTVAAGLALKYEFIPKRERIYQSPADVSVRAIRKSSTNSQLPSFDVNDANRPNVQVIAARNYVDKQPLAETISYSYIASSAPVYPVSVVIAPSNYIPQNVVVMNSQVQEDYFEFYVVGYAFNDEGYNLESKKIQQQIESAIAQNALDGCAPLNINCSRTASDSSQLSIERGPIKAQPSAPKSQRQLLSE